MVEMTCEEHDRQAASTQFVTHTVGRMLGAMEVRACCIVVVVVMLLLEFQHACAAWDCACGTQEAAVLPGGRLRVRAGGFALTTGPHPCAALTPSPLQLQSTDINTRGFEALLNLVNNTANDSFELYYGLFLYNQNATEELERLEQVAAAARLLLMPLCEAAPARTRSPPRRPRCLGSPGPVQHATACTIRSQHAAAGV